MVRLQGNYNLSALEMNRKVYSKTLIIGAFSMAIYAPVCICARQEDLRILRPYPQDLGGWINQYLLSGT